MNAFNQRYWISKELAEDLTKLASSMYDPNDPAREINNPKPLLEILGIRKPLSMEEKLERLFRGPRGLIQQMYEQGEETPEEMNDLDIEDDVEPLSPYEYQVMVEERPSSIPTPSSGPSAGDPKPPEEKTETSPEATSPEDD